MQTEKYIIVKLEIYYIYFSCPWKDMGKDGIR